MKMFLLYGVWQRKIRGPCNPVFLCGVNAESLEDAIASLGCRIDNRWLFESKPVEKRPLYTRLFGHDDWMPDEFIGFKPHLSTSLHPTAIRPNDAKVFHALLQNITPGHCDNVRRQIDLIRVGMIGGFDAYHIGEVNMLSQTSVTEA